jgi:glutamine amidotransferase
MIAVVKYNAGNIKSLMNALARLEVEPILTDDPDVLTSADKVIFPGVGEASSAMAYLRERKLDQVLTSLKQPFLGICLGQQLMGSYSEEGEVACLGIFPEKVKKFPPRDKVPHIGWNNFEELKGPLFEGIEPTDDMYFVHSFYMEQGVDTIASTNYILPFSAAVQKDNFYAVQFHPEKSAAIGQRLLQNFLNIT